MEKITIEKLTLLTGACRRTIQRRLSSLEPIETKSPGTAFYDSEKALALIFVAPQPTAEAGTKTLTAARIAELDSRTELNRIKIETEQKTRPHLDLVIALMESISSEIINIHRGIPDDAATRLSEELRDIPNRLKW